jgi:hypothetical protein
LPEKVFREVYDKEIYDWEIYDRGVYELRRNRSGVGAEYFGSPG